LGEGLIYVRVCLLWVVGMVTDPGVGAGGGVWLSFGVKIDSDTL